MGNLHSIKKKIDDIGFKAIISNDVNIILNADKLILPGVGHFKKATEQLRKRGIWDILDAKVLKDKTPILGICLGLHLMAKYSEEGNVDGFGWLDATVHKFNLNNTLRYKIPHIGWNTLNFHNKSVIYNKINNKSLFYFLHSYYISCNNKDDIITSTEYEIKFVSSIQKDNIYGTQFHPEKSHEYGKKVFENFLKI